MAQVLGIAVFAALCATDFISGLDSTLLRPYHPWLVLLLITNSATTDCLALFLDHVIHPSRKYHNCEAGNPFDEPREARLPFRTRLLFRLPQRLHPFAALPTQC